MSKKKIISTLAFLINSGIGSTLYYDTTNQHKKLKGAKAYWNDKTLCVSIDGKTYKLQVVEE